MLPTSFTRRGKRTLIILIILRLIPPLFFLLIVLILAGFKENFYAFVQNAGGNSPQIFVQIFSTIINSGILLFIALCILFLVIALLEYWTVLYKFDDGAFTTRTGIFHLTELSIPYHQIENVDINRPLLYRFFKMSRIVILTAGFDDNLADGHDSNQTSLDLIDSNLAETIKQELLKRSTFQRTY